MIRKVILGDCLEKLSEFPDSYIDLTVTSPPYDNLRTYNNSLEWNFEIFQGIAKELFRVTKDGGILVWVIGDETSQFCESLSSFKQAIYFVEECKFNLLDTMVYQKKSYPLAYPTIRRYAGVFEYMFVFCKGKPKTFNPLKEIKSESSIGYRGIPRFRQKNGSLKDIFNKESINNKEKQKTNVWIYLTGSRAGEDKIKFNHPATFPNLLAENHILSWSNENDIVLDPFAGSGTVGKMAKQLNRQFILIEKDEDYYKICLERIK